MNLYKRTITAIIPFWKQLLTASLSAAIHAILSGMLVWMVGPLLMTLFQVGGVENQVDSVIEQPLDPSATSEIVKDLTGSVDTFKEVMKNWINELVLSDTRQNTLIKFCWLIMIIVVGKNLFLYLQGFFMAFVQQSIIRSFRDKLFEKYQRLSLDYFHSRRTGQIISRVTNDVVVLNESIDIGFNRLVTDSIMAILFAAFLVVISWKLTLLAMVIMPLVFLFIWFIGKKLRKYSERSQERMADVNAVLEESVNNIRIVKAFSMEKFEIKKFYEATYNFFKALLRMTRIRHLASPINDTLTSIAGIIILIYAGSQIIDGTGELDAGDFMTYVVAMFSLIKPVKSLSQIHIKLQEGMAAAERIFNVLDTPEKVTDPATPKILTNLTDSIKYSNISFSYNGTDKVLDDISFSVRKGEVVAFVGPSGGGKSTLLDLLPRFYDPQSGSISIDNYNIKELSLNSLRSLMGIVTQETYLFNDTVRNNIAYGIENVSDKTLRDAAQMANAHEFISKLDNGYDTPVGNRGVMLSGGQRQRLAIARALLKNPQILIFDEATSALDTESELLVQDAIDKLMSSRTSLVIAHRLSTIQHADRIIVIEKGKIVEQGSHRELLQLNGTYKRLHSIQFRES